MSKKQKTTVTDRRIAANLCALMDGSNPFAYARKLNEFQRGLDDPAEAAEEALRHLHARGLSAERISQACNL